MSGFLKHSIVICALLPVFTGASAQTAVNKGTLHVTNGGLVYFGDDFTNDGNYHNDGKVIFNRNLTNNGSMSDSDTGTVWFSGRQQQVINGSAPASLFRLVLNNTLQGIAYQLESRMLVRKEADFSNGVVKTTTSGVMAFGNRATAVHVADASHVSGRVTKAGNEAFTFPVGNDDFYRPVGISAPSGTDETISAQYFFRNGDLTTYNPTITDQTIGAVNKNEYWELKREAGTTPVLITLSWDASKTHTAVASLPDLLMAKWDHNNKWTRASQQGTASGTSDKGTLLSGSAQDELGAFTFSELLQQVLIGLAQLASEPRLEADRTYSVTFTMIVRNMGNVPLENVQIAHNLEPTFSYPMEYRKVGQTNATAGVVTNPGFDGRMDIQLLNALSKLAPQQQDTISFTMNIAPNGRYGTFLSSATATGESNGQVAKDISNDKVISPRSNIPTPVTIKPLKIFIPEGISPNGDGRNDRFKIDGLTPNDQVDFKIFNRWGDAVFEDGDYKNQWDGRSNRGLRIGDMLPDGTYYYVITIKDRTQPSNVQRFAGFLTLMR